MSFICWCNSESLTEAFSDIWRFWGYVWIDLLPLSFFVIRSSAGPGLPYCYSLTASISAQVRIHEGQRSSVKCGYLNTFINHWLCVVGFVFCLRWIFKFVFRTPTSRVTVSIRGCQWWSQWEENRDRCCHWKIKVLVPDLDFLGSCLKSKLCCIWYGREKVIFQYKSKRPIFCGRLTSTLGKH